MPRRSGEIVRTRRGSVAVAVLIVLLLMGLFVVGIVKVGARDQDLGARRLETVRAFYAAEGGINMALREVTLGLDEDNDGSIGTISDDGNDANDPMFGPASVQVELDFSLSTLTLRSRGRAGAARRKIESTHAH
ncbi:MAG: hypothetical protein O7G85_09060 [Planctomycetota bacterium]|nr:hypothetical protein [Planctomycetota bacterium]